MPMLFCLGKKTLKQIFVHQPLTNRRYQKTFFAAIHLCKFAAPKTTVMENKAVYYGDYLQLEKITGAQEPESFKEGKIAAHDEMLFIIIHQAYELWFKQILFEVGSVIDIMSKPALNDNSPEMQTVVHRLKRVTTILKVLVQQIDIMETMTPMDFLD